MATVVFLSAQTPVITGSIRLPFPAWELLTTVRTSVPNWSCLATQSPEKKARKPKSKTENSRGSRPGREIIRDKEFQREAQNTGQRFRSSGLLHPVILSCYHLISQHWRFFPLQPINFKFQILRQDLTYWAIPLQSFEVRGKR